MVGGFGVVVLSQEIKKQANRVKAKLFTLSFSVITRQIEGPKEVIKVVMPARRLRDGASPTL